MKDRYKWGFLKSRKSAGRLFTRAWLRETFQDRYYPMCNKNILHMFTHNDILKVFHYHYRELGDEVYVVPFTVSYRGYLVHGKSHNRCIHMFEKSRLLYRDNGAERYVL